MATLNPQNSVRPAHQDAVDPVLLSHVEAARQSAANLKSMVGEAGKAFEKLVKGIGSAADSSILKLMGSASMSASQLAQMGSSPAANSPLVQHLKEEHDRSIEARRMEKEERERCALRDLDSWTYRRRVR